MIPIIRGWRVVRDGDSLVELPPAGDELEGIRYWERRRPAMSPVEVVRTLPVPSGAQLIAMSPPRSLVTDEGEYATLITSEWLHEGLEVHRAIGIVHIDDFDAVTLGNTRRKEAAARCDELVESLTRRDRHFFAVRRRPYLYTPPVGWTTVLADGYATTWRSPQGARHITVLPALPQSSQDPRQALEELLDLEGARGASTPISARGGLRGETYPLRCAAGVVDVALLQDARFSYGLCELPHEPGSDGQGALAALISSIEPIPMDRWQRRNPVGFSHWSD